jgi:ABC-type multidrug transport system permease subunit
VITAVFGLAFGGRGEDSKVARIKVAVVDEDRSFLGSLFKSALNQGEAADHFESITLSRTEALQQLQADKLSAAIIIPTNFTSHYLQGKSGLVLEVVKNPAQSFYPAIVEELCAVAVAGLNAISRNLQTEFPAIRGAFADGFSLQKTGDIFERLGNRAEAISEYISPPLISYQKATAPKEEKQKSDLSVFALILPGMASAFLLFLADHAMRDIHHELRTKTLNRIRGMTTGMGTFVIEKVGFTALTVLLGSGILFGSGRFIFGVDWHAPGLVAISCAAYSLFAAGFMAMLVAIAGNERRSERINSMILFGIAFVGGSYFPADTLPAVIRNWISPLMPNFWFIENIRSIAGGESFAQSFRVVLQLGAVGVILAFVATIFLRRQVERAGSP